MGEIVKEIQKDGHTYIKRTFDDGTFIEELKSVPIPYSEPEYKTLMDKEDTDKIKTGVMTQAEQQKLLVAIALKLGVI